MQIAHRRQQRKWADVHQRELQTKTQHTHKPLLSHQTPLWAVQVQKSKLSSLKSHIISSLLSLVIYLAHLSPAPGSRPSRYFSSISTFKSTRWSIRSINYLLNAGCLPKCRLTGWRVSLARCFAAVVARLCASYWYSQKYANDRWHHQVHGLHVAPCWTDESLSSSWLKTTHKNPMTGASCDYISEEINVHKSIKCLGFWCYSTLVFRIFFYLATVWCECRTHVLAFSIVFKRGKLILNCICCKMWRKEVLRPTKNAMRLLGTLMKEGRPLVASQHMISTCDSWHGVNKFGHELTQL